jgi:hypothetical protein
MVRADNAVSPSSDTFNPQMFRKDPARESEGYSDSTLLVRPGLVEAIRGDDSEDEDPGEVIINFNTREDDGEISGQAPTGSNRGLLDRRINDRGQDLVYELFARYKLSHVSEWFFGSVEESTLRNYRRGFTLFATLLQEEGIELSQIVDSSSAVSAMVRVFKCAFKKKIKLSAVQLMKTAMVRVFNLIYNVDLSQAKVLQMALRYYTLRMLPKKEPVRLDWSIGQLFSYLRGLKPFKELEFDTLTAVTAALCIALTALRFTELMRLWVFDSEPDYNQGSWKLWTHVKNHDFVEPIWIHVVRDEHLNLVTALCELKERVSSWHTAQTKVCETLWHRHVRDKLVPLSYNELRAAVRSVLQDAGICENRPYYIKHATMTSLNEKGASANELANFARHKHGSMIAYQNYISNDGGKRGVARLVDEGSDDDSQLCSDQ